jgi:uncharacterized damage-inducible protein DinB
MEYVFETLWNYAGWANDLVLNTLEGLGADAPASCLRLMSHVVNAQTNWLNRLNGDTSVVPLWEPYPVEKIRVLNAATLEGLKVAMDRFGGDIGQMVAYKNMSGVPFENTVADILLQVFNHGTYHRAQIAMDLREKGLEPVNTDYITFVRMR